MVKKVTDSHVTSYDLFKTLDNIVETNPTLNTKITDVSNQSNIFICKVLRFYPIRDICYVNILNTNTNVYAYLTHDILSRDVALESMVNGNIESDPNQGNGNYITPHSTIYGIVAKVRSLNLTDEYCLISCLNYKDNDNLKSNIHSGEIKLTSGESSISLTKERVNILCPELFINGLPFSNPEFENYHNVDEVNSIVEDIGTTIKGYYYNNEFYEDVEHTTLIDGEENKKYFDISSSNLYNFANDEYILISGGSSTYTAGEGIDISSDNVISSKVGYSIDGTTLVFK